MTSTDRRSFDFWSLHGPGWLLLVYLIYAQGISAFSYDLGVAMETQESSAAITDVGVAFFYGFAFGDLVFYIPILLAGLIGHLREARWSSVVLAAALGITVYWPIVCLAALVDVRDAAGWNVASETPYWIVCLIIAAWGAWGLGIVLRESNRARTTST